MRPTLDQVALMQMTVQQQAARLLAIDNVNSDTFLNFRKGARTRAVMATRDGVAHGRVDTDRQVVVKLYKGTGKTDGSRQYQKYHQCDFQSIAALSGNTYIQQSISGGLKANVGPFAILQYIEGEELAIRLDRADLTKPQATTILRDIIDNIWIPLWHGGMRFKDCHAGNFVLKSNLQVVMIDTEQMRKGAAELLATPEVWTQRDKHQAMGLRRLPGLMRRVIEATRPDITSGKLLSSIKESLDDTDLTEKLALLGKQGLAEEAIRASDTLLRKLVEKGLIA